jgi:hypothetical protein
MKNSHVIWSVVVSLSLFQTVSGQGFQNQGFEANPILVGPDLGIGSRYVIPDWTVSFNNTPQQSGVWIGAYILDYTTAAIFVSPSAKVIAGSQSVFLAASSYEAAVGGFSTESISQTGTVPSMANSIQFKLGTILGFGGTVDLGQPQNNFYVTLNDQIVPLQIIANNGSYLTLAGDVSMWAGQSAQVSIGVGVPYQPFDNGEILYSGIIDDVSFSPSPVPEPKVLSIFFFSVLFILWCLAQPNNSPEPTAIGALRSAVAGVILVWRRLIFRR